MRFIPRKYHAILDYLYVLIVIVSPWLFGFSNIKTATNIAYLLSLAVLLVSLNTDYEGGASKVLSMPLHLKIDMIVGLLLLLSPWIFGFYPETYLFHVIAGAFSIAAGLCTVSRSEHPRSKHVD